MQRASVSFENSRQWSLPCGHPTCEICALPRQPPGHRTEGNSRMFAVASFRSACVQGNLPQTAPNIRAAPGQHRHGRMRAQYDGKAVSDRPNTLPTTPVVVVCAAEIWYPATPCNGGYETVFFMPTGALVVSECTQAVIEPANRSHRMNWLDALSSGHLDSVQLCRSRPKRKYPCPTNPSAPTRATLANAR